MTVMNGSCHCGAVTFTVKLSDGIATARRCDCSLCARRGAVAVSAAKEDITYTAGQDNLTRYQFNTKVAAHYFCKTCGIYTHHNRRSNTAEIGVNLACLEGQTPFLSEVIVNDGQNHPKDVGRDGIVGVLRFERMEGVE
ncbi:GFA family protein [Yoonia sp. GPGPB17]|uniref:GFA family protein n=2 Tax=Yoonia sp. GPGPB17 TaxID=3026147 RepID=UPI0030C3AAB8